jgi:hypothetical protein
MKKLLLIGAALLALTSVANAGSYPACAVVLKTSDGFLAVRQKPTSNSPQVGTLRPGDYIEIDWGDGDLVGSPWVSVTGSPKKRMNDGYVFTKNILPINVCPRLSSE